MRKDVWSLYSDEPQYTVVYSGPWHWRGGRGHHWTGEARSEGLNVPPHPAPTPSLVSLSLSLLPPSPLSTISLSTYHTPPALSPPFCHFFKGERAFLRAPRNYAIAPVWEEPDTSKLLKFLASLRVQQGDFRPTPPVCRRISKVLYPNLSQALLQFNYNEGNIIIKSLDINTSQFPPFKSRKRWNVSICTSKRKCKRGPSANS